MENISKWLKNAIEKYGEPLEAIVVGPHDKRRYDDPTVVSDENVILTPEDGLKKLDVEYDAGFGGADCYPMYAWTKSRVFWVAEYDGATSLAWAPRNPTAIKPQFSGQGDY